MLVLELLVEMGDKAKCANKFIRVKGNRAVEFIATDGALVLEINESAPCPTCGELRNFIQANYISKFDKVLIADKDNLEPASSCSNWNDEIMIDQTELFPQNAKNY